jgi:hypothetical protein
MAVKASRVRDTNYPQAHLPPVRYKLRRNSYTRCTGSFAVLRDQAYVNAAKQTVRKLCGDPR